MLTPTRDTHRILHENPLLGARPGGPPFLPGPMGLATPAPNSHSAFRQVTQPSGSSPSPRRAALLGGAGTQARRGGRACGLPEEGRPLAGLRTPGARLGSSRGHCGVRRTRLWALCSRPSTERPGIPARTLRVLSTSAATKREFKFGRTLHYTSPWRGLGGPHAHPQPRKRTQRGQRGAESHPRKLTPEHSPQPPKRTFGNT